MSDETPRRGYGLGDDPDVDDHAPRKAHQIPARALETRRAWDGIPWGQLPPAQRMGSAASVSDPMRRRRLRRSLLLTLASTVLPGSGLLGAPQRWLKMVGATTSLAAVALGLYFLMWALRDTAGFASIAVDPAFLNSVSFSLIGAGLMWVALIAATHIATRPDGLAQAKRILGAGVVTALAFGVSAPAALGARYSQDQVMLVEKVFGSGDAGGQDVQASSRPTLGTQPRQDPWEGIPRVNVLLLGADGNEARAEQVEMYSVRTDTIMVASIDTVTGDTLLVQIPRNVQYTPFPEGSEMAETFPYGFRGEPAEDWLVNSIWAKVELDYPNLMQGNTYRGAEALKQGVEGITGLEIDYFMMLDIDGLQRLIDAMGGVRVNINEPLPMGSAKNCRDPERCLMPGPDQRLNGYEAMWYARSRSTTSDYSRMARQSCLIDAVIHQANPTTLLTSYEGIAQAASHMVVTDIPQRDLKAFVQLGFKVKDAEIQRLLYSNLKNGYNYNDPDFEAMRQAVEDALNPPAPVTPTAPSGPPATSASPSATATASPAAPTTTATEPPDELAEGAQSVADACAWHGWPDEEG